MHKKKFARGILKNIKKISRFYILIILLTIPLIDTQFVVQYTLAEPPNYYVNCTSGSDTNDGSFSHPWRTIEHAVSFSSSGDTINLMAGTFTPTAQVDVSNKNTNSQWYTIKNYNNGKVIIQGSNCPKSNYIDAVFDFYNCDYVHLSGLSINHSARGAITIRSGSSHFKIDNCSITNNSQHAIKAVNTNNLTIEHNYVYNNFNNWSGITGADDGGLSEETISLTNCVDFSINNNTLRGNRELNIDIKSGGNRGEIDYNTINTTAGFVKKAGAILYGNDGIYIDARGVIKNITIFNNNIFGNKTGISVNNEVNTGHYEYIYIYNNQINITKEPFGGMTGYAGRFPLILENDGESSDVYHNIYIYSNLFHTGINNGYPCLQVGSFNGGEFSPSNLKKVFIVNNIFSKSETTAVNMVRIAGITFAQGTSIFTMNNNSFYRATGSITIFWGTTTYTPSTPTYFGGEPIFTDPKFVHNTDQYGDFHLQSNSPCIDTGNTTLAPCFDFDRISRPQGLGMDIGSFEFVSSETTYPQISNLSLLSSNPLDTDPVYGWENVSCLVTDNVSLSQVVLRIQNPNGSWNNVSMTCHTSGTYYYRTSTLFSTAGNYIYSVLAKDINNIEKTSNSVSFTMPPNWDINADALCNILDLVLISNSYGLKGSQGWVREDLDNNGVINVLDLNLVSNHLYG